MGRGKIRGVSVGDRFGRLVVEREEAFLSGKDWRSLRTRYICRCDCGKVLVKAGYVLANNHVRSCGCLKRDLASAAASSKKKHGFAVSVNKPPEYMTWVRMRRRCENKSCQDWPHYGERGIRVCRRWSESVVHFIEDMGRRPGKGFSIDRIDVNGNYSCGHCEECLENGWVANCRWANIKQQNRNKTTARILEIDGITKTLPEWSDISGLSQETIRGRLNRGWSDKDAVFFA